MLLVQPPGPVPAIPASLALPSPQVLALSCAAVPAALALHAVVAALSALTIAAVAVLAIGIPPAGHRIRAGPLRSASSATTAAVAARHEDDDERLVRAYLASDGTFPHLGIAAHGAGARRPAVGRWQALLGAVS